MKRTVQATPDMEAAYQEVMAGLKRACDRFPSIRTLEVIALLSRATGYCVAACYPDERDLARATAIENIDQAVKDTAQDIPWRPGVRSAGR